MIVPHSCLMRAGCAKPALPVLGNRQSRITLRQTRRVHVLSGLEPSEQGTSTVVDPSTYVPSVTPEQDMANMQQQMPPMMDPRYMQAPPPGYPQQNMYPGYPPQQQGAPQQYYYGAPSPYQMAPPQQSSTGDGIPWFVYFMLGAAAIKAFDLIQAFVKKGPQQMMAEMAMKQMMGSMGGAAPPNPFAGAKPPGGNPFGFPPSPPPQASPTSPIDTTAESVPNGAAPWSAGSGSDKGAPGSKFAARMGTPGSPSASASSPWEIVEPTVREPPPVRGSPPAAAPPPPPKSDFSFSDVDDAGKASKAMFGAAAAAAAADAGASSSGSDGMDNSGMNAMMENMLKNPEMQKMLYPYLPEPMRNPESIEFMMNNPEVRKQMEGMFNQQGMNMSPQMMNMMKGMDFNQDKVNSQFAELGLKPEDVMSKVMANPELTAGFSNPKVQAAIVDISQNPMNITKYQNDPEIMKVLEKVTEIFSPQVKQ